MNDGWWERAYRGGRPEDTPWETGKPDRYLVRIVEEGMIRGKRVLDACSGLGTQAIFLASHGYEVSGVEISPTAVRKARDRAMQAGVNVDFINTRVQRLPFPDGSFDFVFDRGCLHHQYGRDLSDYLREVRRVLKTRGRMYIMAFASRFTFEELEGLFKRDFVFLDYFRFREEAADHYVRAFQGLLIEKRASGEMTDAA